MPDPDETAGENVEEKAGQELVGRREGHRLDAVPPGVVFPPEAHDALIQAHQPLVGDGHAVGVAPEILQHLFGTGEGPLGVDHPVVSTERG